MNARLKCGVWTSGLLALALGTTLAISSSCGRSGMDCEPGGESCPCLSGGTCDSNLTCASDVCISTATGPSIGGAGGAGGAAGTIGAGGTTGTTGAGGKTGTTSAGGTCGPIAAQCSPIAATNACGACAGSCCCSELAACYMNASCYKALQCAIACGLATPCRNNCVASSPSAGAAVLDLYNCVSSNCLSVCQ